MSVVSLEDVKTHLNLSGTTHDTELAAMIDAAVAVVAKHVGALEAVSVSKRVRGGGDALVLPSLPVASLTSVTPVDGDALDLADLYLDGDAGVVSYDAGGSFTARAYDVVYSVGRSTVPDDLVLAVKELVRHLWGTQRGASRIPGAPVSEAASNTLPGAGYLLPFRVSELLAPHIQPGFA